MGTRLTRSLTLLSLCAMLALPVGEAAAGEPLRLRLESAIGTQTCINSDTAACTAYPTGFEGQETGAYGRIGATIIFRVSMSRVPRVDVKRTLWSSLYS